MTDGNDIVFSFGDSPDTTTNYSFISEYCCPLVENLTLAMIPILSSILYCAIPPRLHPIFRPPLLFSADMIFMFNPPVKPNNISCDLRLVLENRVIKKNVKREKSLFFRVMCFIDK